MNVRTSIIIVVHDQEEELRQNLPAFLQIAEKHDAEVIVVDDMSSDETADVLKQFKSSSDRLYITFLPNSVVINPNRQRLALVIGMKAAKGSCIILADIKRPPVSDDWLGQLPIDDIEKKLTETVLIYTGRKQAVPPRHQEWTYWQDARAIIMKAERHSGRGHKAKWLKFRRGVYDAIAIHRDNMYLVLPLFDNPLKSIRLWSCRLKVYCKNLFNRS